MLVLWGSHRIAGSMRVQAQEAVSLPTFLEKSAHRLQKRIAHRYGVHPSISDLMRSITDQRTLLQASTAVEYRSAAGDAWGEWSIRMEEHAAWLRIEMTPEGPLTALSTEAIAADVLPSAPEMLRHAPQDAILTAVTEEKYVTKVSTDRPAKAGFIVPVDTIGADIAHALENRMPQLSVTLEQTPGKILNQTGQDLGDLTLLAVGKSNFGGSGLGRKFNIRKGLAEHLHNTLVPPGETFSLNSVIADVPVREWQMALGIFNGHELRMVAGGGICQVATTMYRAALNAGLQIEKRANHSLFVHYYEKYGVGIDATVFPGAQDLTIKNDTGDYLLIQAYTEGDEARVSLFGTDDGRRVTMNGPYFSANAPENFPAEKRALRANEIGWTRSVEYADGRTQHETILSRYKAIPTSVIKTHTAAPVDPLWDL